MTDEDSRHLARKILASALYMKPTDVPDEAAIGTVSQWDSLSHLRLIIAMEEHLGRPMAPEAVVAIGSLADIAAALEEKP